MHLPTLSLRSPKTRAKSSTLSASIGSVCQQPRCWTRTLQNHSVWHAVRMPLEPPAENYLFLFLFPAKENRFKQFSVRLPQEKFAFDEWRAVCKSNFQFLCKFTVCGSTTVVAGYRIIDREQGMIETRYQTVCLARLAVSERWKPFRFSRSDIAER